MSKIKVIHCVDNMGCGGLEQVVRMLVCALDPARFELEVWCIASGGEVADQIQEQGITVRILGIMTYHNLFNILKLAALFRKHKPHIVHSHIYYASTISRIAAKLAGTPVSIVHMHNVYLNYKKRNLWMDRTLSHMSDRIICCSKAVQDFVVQREGISRDKSMVIYNGIDKSRFERPFDAQQLKMSLNIQPGDFVMITVASLMAKKGHIYLFDALAQLVKDNPRVKSLLVGYGTPEEEAEVRGYARKLNLEGHAMFLGLRADVGDLLRIADLFVLSSLTEGLPLSIIEAMAAGLAVVATDVGGVKEVVEDGATGILVGSQNGDALAKAIQRLIDDPALRATYAQNASRVSQEKFSSKEMVKKVERVYLDLVAKNISVKGVL